MRVPRDIPLSEPLNEPLAFVVFCEFQHKQHNQQARSSNVKARERHYRNGSEKGRAQSIRKNQLIIQYARPEKTDAPEPK
jgi:hypothetical protein